MPLKETFEEAKKTFGESTEKVEKAARDFFNQTSPHYTNLEPWKRGLILLGILAGTITIIYLLTSKDDQPSKKQLRKEAIQEERLLRKLELIKKIKE